ncbi:MAG: hypothetical protein KY453_12020 [Gemmatimonadetes bacterium]|nr:hypothetical protein [Gemmatimonadota bacterium]
MKSCAACGGVFEISEGAGKFCPRCRGVLETGRLSDPVTLDGEPGRGAGRGPADPETPGESPGADLPS